MQNIVDEWGREYEIVQPLYAQLSKKLHGFLIKQVRLAAQYNPSFKFLLLTGREKKLDKFKTKASRFKKKTHVDDPDEFNYKNPLLQITDLSGVRVIVYSLDDIKVVREIVEKNFVTVGIEDKYNDLIKDGKFGYQALHLMVKLKEGTTLYNSNPDLVNLITEIQIKTILGHAWAEIEHRSYDSRIHKIGDADSVDIVRRFQIIAGLLEIADREFNDLKRFV